MQNQLRHDIKSRNCHHMLCAYMCMCVCVCCSPVPGLLARHMTLSLSSSSPPSELQPPRPLSPCCTTQHDTWVIKTKIGVNGHCPQSGDGHVTPAIRRKVTGVEDAQGACVLSRQCDAKRTGCTPFRPSCLSYTSTPSVMIFKACTA